MRKIQRTVMILLGFVAGSAGVAVGGRNAGGALVLHASDMGYQFRIDFCSEYPLPPTCEELNTQVNRDPSISTIIWVVAAFPAMSSPGVTAYQFGIYGDIPQEYFDAWASCPTGGLEIPDDTWPAPGTGTAVAPPAPIYDHMFKVYWFAAAAPYIGAALSTGAYPHGSMLAQFADDSDPPQVDDCLKFGTVRWGSPGENDCPDVPPPTGACCHGGVCRVTTQADCEAAGDTFMGVGTTCDPNPCNPSPTRPITWGGIKAGYR